jgi:hypothetical protein
MAELQALSANRTVLNKRGLPPAAGSKWTAVQGPGAGASQPARRAVTGNEEGAMITHRRGQCGGRCRVG